MGKKLAEMTIKELWQLFPICLTEHQAGWHKQYEDEAQRLQKALAGMPMVRLSHIGSTAVPTIWAKPIVDMMLEVPFEKKLRDYADILVAHGYSWMSHDNMRISLNKGYTEEGFAQEVFHLHLRYKGDNDELYFRDYLLAHPDVAKAYEALKLTLGKIYKYNRNGYTEAKTEFIKQYTKLAKQEYKGRY